MPRSGLSSLVRGIRAYFEANDVEAEVCFGLRARFEWSRPRVVVIPGHYDGKTPASSLPGGSFGAPTQKSRVNPAEVAKWEREITFSLFAADEANGSDEEAQNAALEDLVEALQQAVWLGIDPEAPAGTPPIGAAGLVFGDSLVVKPPTDLGYGEEIIQWARMLTPLYFPVRPVAYPAPDLRKLVLAPGGSSGTNASITSASSGLVAVTGLGGVAQGSWVGQWLTISGATLGANNGTFPIVGFTSPSAIVVQNVAGFAPDPANGSITWQLDPLGV